MSTYRTLTGDLHSLVGAIRGSDVTATIRTNQGDRAIQRPDDEFEIV